MDLPRPFSNLHDRVINLQSISDIHIQTPDKVIVRMLAPDVVFAIERNEAKILLAMLRELWNWRAQYFEPAGSGARDLDAPCLMSREARFGSFAAARSRRLSELLMVEAYADLTTTKLAFPFDSHHEQGTIADRSHRASIPRCAFDGTRLDLLDDVSDQPRIASPELALLLASDAKGGS